MNTSSTRATTRQAPKLHSWEVPAYLLVGAIALLIQSCRLIVTADAYHEAGATYPGGCAAYTQAATYQLIVFFFADSGLLALLAFCLRRLTVKQPYRTAVLVAYVLFTLVGPYVLLVPPAPQ